jgi:hypothetical protein
MISTHAPVGKKKHSFSGLASEAYPTLRQTVT